MKGYAAALSEYRRTMLKAGTSPFYRSEYRKEYNRAFILHNSWVKATKQRVNMKKGYKKYTWDKKGRRRCSLCVPTKWTERERAARHYSVEARACELRKRLASLELEHYCIDHEFWAQRRKA